MSSDPSPDEPDRATDESSTDAAADRPDGAEVRRLVGVGAPPVVAVVVTKDPGDWFEATLESLAEQDYGQLSVLVIDNGSDVDPTDRVADVMPTAFVKRLEENRGFGAAANEVLTAVEGAAFLLFLHDDVQLRPDTVTMLVAEAFRSTAGIVGPKLVEGDRPDRLRSVGYSVDPYGFASPIAEPGELDQSQHDLVREVFAVSDAAMLVRADLFETLGGFTETIPYFGEDIDLCWRAHIAGATVYLSPNAVVGHDERFAQRRPDEDRQRLELRHEARAMLANYSFGRLLAVMPMVVLFSLIDLLGSMVMGRFRRAGDIVSAWTWNLMNLPSLMRERSRVRQVRRVKDTSYLSLMRQGSSRLSSLVRSEDDDGRLVQAAQAGRGYIRDISTGEGRYGLAVALLVFAVLVVGARDLFAGYLPEIREFSAFASSGRAMLSEWFTAWREVGFGESAVPPLSVSGSGVVAVILWGTGAAARRLIILAPLFIGALGAWKLLVRSASTTARAGAVVAYGLNPVALNALAEGRLQALVVYAIAPWLLRRVATGAEVVPFVRDPRDPAEPDPQVPIRRGWLSRTAGTALLLLVVAAFTPVGAALLVMSITLLAVVLGVSGQRHAFAMIPAVLVATLFAAVVSSPWLVPAILNGDAASLTNLWVTRAASPSAVDIITGGLGPVVTSWFGWGIVAAAAYAVLVGRDWRLRWAVASWILTLVSWAGAIALARAGLFGGIGLELVLVPAALGLAVAVAMGACAFDRDVIGSDFGLRQLLSAVAVVALFIGVVPVAVGAAQGRWYVPEGDFARVLRPIEDDGSNRTLWIGDPDALPVAGWTLQGVEGIVVGTSVGLTPTLSDQYRLDGGEGVESLTDAVLAAMNGETSRLGRVLAPMGISYVIAVQSAAPQPFATEEIPIPDGAVSALREQLDLTEFELNPAMAAFRVNDPWPLRSDITDVDLDGVTSWRDLLLRPIETVPEAVLGTGVGTQMHGELEADRIIARSGTDEDGWTLTVEGDEASSSPLFGWQQQFTTPTDGEVTLSWSPPLLSRALQVVQVVGLLALLVAATRRRRSAAAPQRRRRVGRRADAEPLVVVGDALGDDPLAGHASSTGSVSTGEHAALNPTAAESITAGPGTAGPGESGRRSGARGEGHLDDAAEGTDVTGAVPPVERPRTVRRRRRR